MPLCWRHGTIPDDLCALRPFSKLTSLSFYYSILLYFVSYVFIPARELQRGKDLNILYAYLCPKL